VFSSLKEYGWIAIGETKNSSGEQKLHETYWELQDCRGVTANVSRSESRRVSEKSYATVPWKTADAALIIANHALLL
jgi:acyl CoA:acetate/3-ketoacid CoA transferase alpha subunit